jgi:hypothetical protein
MQRVTCVTTSVLCCAKLYRRLTAQLGDCHETMALICVCRPRPVFAERREEPALGCEEAAASRRQQQQHSHGHARAFSVESWQLL